MAKPLSYTPEVHEELVGYLSEGNSLETACVLAGVTPRTCRDWLLRGKKAVMASESESKPIPKKIAWAADLYRDVEASQAEFKASELGKWRLNGCNDWKASRDLLARRYPREFGERINLTVDEELHAAMQRLEREFDAEPEILARIYSAIQAPSEGDE